MLSLLFFIPAVYVRLFLKYLILKLFNIKTDGYFIDKFHNNTDELNVDFETIMKNNKSNHLLDYHLTANINYSAYDIYTLKSKISLFLIYNIFPIVFSLFTIYLFFFPQVSDVLYYIWMYLIASVGYVFSFYDDMPEYFIMKNLNIENSIPFMNDEKNSPHTT